MLLAEKQEAELDRLAKRIARRRARLSIFLFMLGVSAVIVGVAVIYWPASLIVGGLLIAGYAVFFIDIPDPSRIKDPRQEGVRF